MCRGVGLGIWRGMSLDRKIYHKKEGYMILVAFCLSQTQGFF
jgi:hypothetical protein